MSTAEELIMIPKNQFMKEQQYSSQIPNNHRVQPRGLNFRF